jgi:hypothetical protein
LIQREEGSFGRVWETKEVYMVKSGALAKPKEFGGLGFIDTRAMNAAVLCKWIFRLDSADDSMCIEATQSQVSSRQEF